MIMSIFLVNLMNFNFFKYLKCMSLKHFCMVLLLNMLFYYNFFMGLKNLMMLKYKSLIDYTGSHYPDLLYEIELNYYLLSLKLVSSLLLKLNMKKEDLIMSLSNIFSSASWFESEMWDMFGVKFMYHKDLSRILTDYGFLGHPLLKYFPLSGFYELSFDDLCNKVKSDLMELAQMFRIFDNMNPWVIWNSNDAT